MTGSTLVGTADDYLSASPSVRPDAELRWYGTEAVAWSPASSAPVHLDAVAAVVYQLLDGTVTVAELTHDVHEVIGVPEPVAQNQLRRVVTLLDEGGLLDSSPVHDRSDDEIGLLTAPPNP